MTRPRNPIEAVTHRDPYSYYADLARGKPLARDESLGCRVAASAAAVRATLESDVCRVRPLDEPVPAPLVGTAAGDVFGRLVRMTDGAGHCPLKRAVSTAVAAVSPGVVREVSRASARLLADEIVPAANPERITELALRLPVHVVGTLLGIASERLAETAALVGDFVGCLAPSAAPERVRRGIEAADGLLDVVRALLESGAPGPLLAALVDAARASRISGATSVAASAVAASAVAANAVGLMSQSYEATAGLVGNTLVALARRPDARTRAAADSGALAGAVDETLQYDAPVQNTRRFVAVAGEVAGQAVEAGETILVVLASANRDAATAERADVFDLDRESRRHFAFGADRHACPGDAVARAAAEAGVERLLRCGVPDRVLAEPASYLPSANVRVPTFASATAREVAR